MPSRDSPKTGRTYYTDERVAAARDAVATHGWASAVCDEAVSAAEEHLSRGLDGLWRLVTGQQIPRAGEAGDGTQRGRWKPGPDPWTVTDGNVVLPTNDFAAYRESGRDDRGFFDPELADDGLLRNIREPAQGTRWGVDDGGGWTDDSGVVADEGTTLVTVAHYNHWYVWYEVRDAVVAFRDAYLSTGERRYARAGLVLLDRIADAYPDLDIDAFDHDRFWNSHGGTGQGRIVGSIWETNLVRQFVSAYDAFYPAVDDAELVDFLAAKAERYPGLPAKDSTRAIRQNIETRLVREVLPAVADAQVRGNLGMHQAALAMSAVVADDSGGYTADALDFLFRSGDLVADEEPWGHRGAADATDRRWRLTGGDLDAALVDRLDRDGYADESAPNYNLVVQRQLLRVADILAVGGDTPDLHEHPKLRRAARAHYPLVFLDRFMPSIGDSGRVGDPDPKLDATTALSAFQADGDPVFARAAYALDGPSVDGLRGDLFAPNTAGLAARVAEAVTGEESGGVAGLGSHSTLLPAYGFAALRDGTPPTRRDGDRDESDTRRGVGLYFGRNSTETGTSHTHADALSLSVYAHGLALAPDLGYPEHTGDWPHRHCWTRATASHNTVVVDEQSQHPQVAGVPRHFVDGGDVSLVDVAAPRAYPQTESYRRTAVQVRIDDRDSYVLDVFRICGGDDHVWSFHGPEGAVETTGVDLTAREGTYAGPEVPRPPRDERDAHDERVGDGFNRLDRVAADDEPPNRFAAEWYAVDTWGARDGADAGSETDVRIRATVLTDCDSVSLADGHPPRKSGNPETLRYLLCRRTGTDLDSTFTTLLEPICGTRRVTDVRRVPVRAVDGSSADATAVRVTLDTGRVDYLAVAVDPCERYIVDEAFTFSGWFARYSVRDGSPTAATLVDGTRLASLVGDDESVTSLDGQTLIDRPPRHRLLGRVVDVTRDLSSENRIAVAVDDCTDPRALVGGHLYVETDGDGNGVYAVEGVRDGERDGEVVFDVGSATTVAGFVDPSDPEAGYEYVVDEGDRVVVPAVERWRSEESER